MRAFHLRLPVTALLLSCSSALAWAQTPGDSLITASATLPDTSRVRHLNQQAQQRVFADATTSRQLAEFALELAAQIGFADGEAESSAVLCGVLTRLGQFAAALDYCERAKATYQQTRKIPGLAETYNRIGMVHNQQGQFAQALENFSESLRLYRQAGMETKVTSIEENIGIIHFRQQDYQLALDYFQGCLKSYKEQKNEAAASKILVNIGAAYNRLGKPAQAIEAHSEALAFFERSGNRVGMGISYNNIGNVYLETGQPAKAVDYYKRSLQVKEKMGDRLGVSITSKNIADAYLGMNNLASATASIEKSLKIAEEIGAQEQVKDAFEILSKIAEKKGEYKKALEYERNLATAKDSLFSREKTEQISKMRAIYENEKERQQAAHELEKRDASIAILNKENELNNAQRNLLMAVAGALLAVAGLTYYLYAQKQKSNVKLSEKNILIEKALADRETLLKEIHHRVKNNLQVISSLLSLQSKSLQDTGAQDAISESRNRVKSMSLIHEQLYQDDTIAGVYMKDYIERLVRSLNQSYGLDSSRVEVKVDTDNILLDVDSAIPLGLIINELVSNSMKYGFPGQREGSILISLRDGLEELRLLVKDSGVGIDPGKNTEQSFGLNMVRSLMRKLKAEMTIESGAGTAVELVIREFRKVTLAPPGPIQA
jgi:two-component sensor histidine kinase/Tfp pilus assembly protein PilF